MHIHVDPVGGVAGDMFVAAVLDAWPELTDPVRENLRSVAAVNGAHVELGAHSDGVLTGSRFTVAPPASGNRSPADDHTPWRDLRASIEGSALPASVRSAATGIFHELARAEAQVHGTPVDDVTFHEVGHWDSVADIVAAATAVAALAPATWSVGPLPLGQGRVDSAHGRLPVPAPATTLLLRGFALHDDGRDGERVTPTGAAILRYLQPHRGLPSGSHVLERTGIGFGARQLEGVSNILRVLVFDSDDSAVGASEQERVGVITFEIDDQTGEDLAVGLDHLRAVPGVLDVSQSSTMGKKGRVMAAIQVLARPEAVADVASACFRETTTLGVRTRFETRTVLRRKEYVTARGVRVKVAERPDGPTAKAEADDVQVGGCSHKERADRRRDAEIEALGASHD